MLMFAAGGRTFTLCARHAYTAGVDCDEATAAECSGISPVLRSFLAMVHRHDEHRKDACPRLPPRSSHQGIATHYIAIVYYIAIVLSLLHGIASHYIAIVSLHCYCIAITSRYCHSLHCHYIKIFPLVTLSLHCYYIKVLLPIKVAVSWCLCSISS